MLDRHTLIELFTALLLGATGLSHIVQPRLWARLFLDVFQRDWAGLFIGALTLPLGLLVVLGHNVWVWDVLVLVTIFGWGWTIKGTLYLLRPKTVQQVGARHMQHPGRFRIAGAIGVVAATTIVASIIVRRSG